MYSRKIYRRPPPGYHGTAFSSFANDGGVREESLTLSEEQRKTHQKENRRMAPLGTTVFGQKLTPMLRGEKETFMFEQRETPTAEEVSASHANDTPSGEDLMLIGALLFLLGSGLSEESALLLIASLFLLS